MTAIRKNTEMNITETRYLEFHIEIPDDGLIIDEKQIGEPEKVMTAVISSANVDRVGDRILPGAFINLSKDGGKVPLLWSHDRSEFPIGKSISIRNDRKNNTVVGKFMFRNSVRSLEAWQLVKEGFVNTVSVGFNVLQGGYEKNEFGGYDISKAELLEVSLVNIPANRDALIQGIKSLQSKGFEFSESTLEEFDIVITEEKDLRRELEDDDDVIWYDKDTFVQKPYENEHACRLNDPKKYSRFARKNCEQKVDNKCVDVIYGIKDNKAEIQALRYPKDVWTEKAARSHCDGRDGTFEAAAKQIRTIDDVVSEIESLLVELKQFTTTPDDESVVEESGYAIATSDLDLEDQVVEESGILAATSDEKSIEQEFIFIDDEETDYE